MSKVYDQAYFDKWYHDPKSAIDDPDEVWRKLGMLVATAEYYLGRAVASVLDVGCGEGNWSLALRQLRPGARYLGLDSSDYVVERYGARRNIMQARFADLAWLRMEQPFDVIICSNVLHYLEAEEIATGLAGLDELLGGVAFLEVYTSEDQVSGDAENYHARPAAWYRLQLRRANLVPIGSFMYVGAVLRPDLLALEACRGSFEDADQAHDE